MNYLTTHRDYFNSGGGCMVGISQVYLADENKTVWVYTNEEGSTMTAVDYLHGGLEPEVFGGCCFDTFNPYFPDVNNKYLPLYVDCQLYFFTEEYKRFRSVGHMPFELIPKGMLVDVPAGYIEWHKENIGNEFETDGCTIIVDESFPRDATNTKIYGAYMPSEDKTAVFRDTLVNNEVVSTECVGWYSGEVSEDNNQLYSHGGDDLIAHFYLFW